MSALSRSAVITVRAASRQCLASTSRLPLTIREYATEVTVPPSSTSPEALMFGGPPPPKLSNEVTMKKYTGKGFPRIPGLRHLILPHHAHLHPGPPLRELTLPLRRKGGRNHTGQVVNRFVGGGHKRRLRVIDFHRTEAGEHDVVRIEYDPGRSAHIALIHRRGIGSISSEADIEKGAKLAEMDITDSPDDQIGKGGVLPKKTVEERRKSRNEVKGGWSYILAPDGLRAGDTVVSYRSGIPKGLVEGWDETGPKQAKTVDPSSPQTVDPPTTISAAPSRALGILRNLTLKPGNVLPLSLLPAGTTVHNISLSPTGRMQLCRSAGTFGQIVAHHGSSGEALGGGEVLDMGGQMKDHGDGMRREKRKGSVLVKLQSGEVRRLEPDCVATVGSVSNKEHHSRQLGKAGRSRWLGQRPRVRGLAMNACDHPHGGGRGKSKGNKDPRSVWGWLTKKRTRRSKDKDGNKMVVSERPRGKDKN